MFMLPKRAWTKIDRRVKMTWTARRADAFLASYPKSGRTWFRHILSHYFAPDGGVGLHAMFEVIPNYDLDPERGIPAFRYRDSGGQVPLILVTHHGYRPSLFLGRPVIFMVRDPRDVMVSAYFHATRHKHRFAGDMNAFLRHESLGLSAYIAYHNGWARGLAGRSSSIVSYEALSADTAGVAGRVLSFLGHAPEPARLAAAVEASRFEAMREDERRAGLPAHDYDREDDESLRMRRGKVGGFSDYLDEDQARLVTERCRRELVPEALRLLEPTGFPAS